MNSQRCRGPALTQPPLTKTKSTDDHSPKELGGEEEDVIGVYQEQREGTGGGCSTILMIFSFKFSSPLTVFNFLN